MALKKIIRIIKKAEKEIGSALDTLLKGKTKKGWKERRVFSKKIGTDKGKDVFFLNWVSL